MAKTQHNPELVEFLQSDAGNHVKVVYFNENGQWLFRKRPGFENAVTSAEIIGVGAIEESSEDIAEKPKKGKK